MNRKEKIDFIFQTLWKQYSDATTELFYTTDFQLLVAVILSAQTTDKQVNKVTAAFFDIIKTPHDLIKIKPEKRETMIAWVNYYKTKAKNIYATAKILAEQSWNKKVYTIPNTLSWLMQLPWVGEKTAKVILHVLYEQPVIAVDTHVHRVANRLWLVKTTMPLQTSELLEKVVPKHYKTFAHHALILFGRYHCVARKPKCESCPFTHICVWYKEQQKWEKDLPKKSTKTTNTKKPIKKK